MFDRRCIALFAIATICLPTSYIVVEAFVVPVQVASAKYVKHESQYWTYLNMKQIDSLSNNSAEQCDRYPQQSKIPQFSNPLVPTCFGVLFGLITMIAPLNLPFSSSDSTIANAADSKIVGSFSGSGLFFKDTLQVEAFDDPKVQGVKLYVSNFILPINERLSSTKNLFSDPSSASLTCARTGPIKIADTIVKGTSGEQVFEESKSLLFKSLKVQRVYDEEDKTLIYVSYNTRLDKNDDSNKSRFKSSLCAIGLE